MPYQLRYLLPLILLAITALLASYNYLRSTSAGLTYIEEQALKESRQLLTLFQTSLQHTSSANKQHTLQNSLALLTSRDNIVHTRVIDSNKNTIAAQEPSQIQQYFTQTTLDSHLNTLINSNTAQTLFSPDRQHLLSLFPLPSSPFDNSVAGPPLYLLIHHNLAQNKLAEQQRVERQVIESSLILLFFIAMIWWLSHRLVAARLMTLLDATRRIADGQTHTRVRFTGKDELSLIGKAIDHMAKEVGYHEERLRHSEQKVRLILDSTAAGLFGVDTMGNCTLSNPACARLLGYESADDLIGKNMHTLIHHSKEAGEDYPQSTCPVFKTLHDGERNHIDNEVFWRADGSSLPVEYWSYPIIDKNKIVGAVVSFLDISERRQAAIQLQNHQNELEERIAERTNNLRTANEELKSFAFSVSHDLRAPLRATRGFLMALEEDYGKSLDHEGRKYLLRAIKASRHMYDLIEDMMVLSRVVYSEMHLVQTNLSEVAQAEINKLQEANPERQIEIKIAPDLHSQCDKNLIRILLHNILANAWKFTRDTKKPKISIDHVYIGQCHIYFIQDNGAGLDMEYADKLFNPFQRLHKHSEFEGTGIGLATCRRIVEKHGGQIWIQGKPDHGATIYFTLNTDSNTEQAKNTILATAL